MNVEKLKQKILDLAIRGKLVPQDPNDEPASVLIEKIRAEKEALIKQGKIKRDKNESYIFKGDDNSYYEKVGEKVIKIGKEIPYNIPTNWQWVRLFKITNSINAGGDRPVVFSKTKTKQCPIPVYSNGKDLNGLYGYTDVAKVTERSITVSARGTIGFSCIRTEPYVPIIRLISIIPNKNISIDYLSIFFQAALEKGDGTSTPQLTVPNIAQKLIALPPREEQDRIVKTFNSAIALINRALLLQNETTDLCDQLKYKILDHYFGDNSRYKSYYKYEENSLSNIATLITKGSTPTTYGFEYLSEGINFIKVENVKDYCVQHNTIKQFISEAAHEFQKRSQLEKDDLLISIAGTLGRICLIKNEDLPANTNQAFAIVRGYTQTLLPDYLKWFVTWYVDSKSQQLGHGGGMDNLTLGEIKALKIKYPVSKDEQQYIIDKVNACLEIVSAIEGVK